MEQGKMATWNYRVMKFVDDEGETYHQIHEVYYDKDGDLKGYTKNPVSLFSSDGVDGLRTSIEKIAAALKKPVLESSDFI